MLAHYCTSVSLTHNMVGFCRKILWVALVGGLTRNAQVSPELLELSIIISHQQCPASYSDAMLAFFRFVYIHRVRIRAMGLFMP